MKYITFPFFSTQTEFINMLPIYRRILLATFHMFKRYRWPWHLLAQVERKMEHTLLGGQREHLHSYPEQQA